MMEHPVGSTEDKQLPWVDASHPSASYQHHIQVSVSRPSFIITPSTDSLPTQYTTLSALQGSFITIQQSPSSEEYQSLQGSVGYQPVYISGSSFEGISSDGDFVVTTGEDGVTSSLQVLNTGQPAVQVPSFILGGEAVQTQESSLSLSGSTQYSLNLSSYLQGLGDTMTPLAANGSVTMDDVSRNLVNMSETESSSEHPLQSHLLQMGLSEVCASKQIQPPSYANLALSATAPRPAISRPAVVGQTPVVEPQPVLDHRPAVDMLGENEADRNTASNDVMERVETRKSERLAQRETSPGPVEPPKYVSKPYNVAELWCDECQTSYVDECVKHRLQSINDKVILSRAWASLPLVLQIFRLSESADAQNAELGVFAKKQIPKRTQFGPFVTPTTAEPRSGAAAGQFVLTVEKDDGATEYIDAHDEDRCNWMMFVRPAANPAEQNLVTYQHGSDIYFSVIKNIEPRQELKVWYAAHYAERMQVNLLSSPTNEQVEDESELQWPCYECAKRFRTSADLQKHLAEEKSLLQWPCYECEKRFRTSADLQKHLAVHDNDVGLPESSDADARNDPECVLPGNSRRGYRRKRQTPTANGDTLSATGQNDASVGAIAGPSRGGEFQSWKKRKTNIYLRKYRMLGRSRRSGAECPHCDLVFDDTTMLDLHTLSHTATDAGTVGGSVTENEGRLETGDIDASTPATSSTCPSCQATFDTMSSLVAHVTLSHGRRSTVRRRVGSVGSQRPFRCYRCWKTFTVEAKLRRHMLSHAENLKDFKCDVCERRFVNNSALACHLKMHSNGKYYMCRLCDQGFDQIHVLRSHAITHVDPITGLYSCPWCHKTFDMYGTARRHARSFHSMTYTCTDCGKTFPRPDKLKLHRLRHSSHREFMCENCGRQFKRKDKFRDHVRRVHASGDAAGSEAESKGRRRSAKSSSESAKFVPKISPMDYQQFIFKCNDCQLGFKRRGMLVNHLAKRHPTVNIATVPELNLPIVRSQRDFYCQYCDKVYKSSSKRKTHIMKVHPGADMPAGARRGVGGEDCPLPNPTYSATVGSVLTHAHACHACHKQYASKAKLLQHQRKKHGSQWWDPLGRVRPRSGPVTVARFGGETETQATGGAAASKLLTAAMITRCLSEGGQVQIIQQSDQAGMPLATESLADSDLLTQAMTELTQSFGTEFRLVTANLSSGSEFQTVVPCIVSVSNTTPVDPVLQTSAPTLEASSNLILTHPAAQVVPKMPAPTQILHTIPKTLSSTLYPLSYISTNTVTKDVL